MEIGDKVKCQYGTGTVRDFYLGVDGWCVAIHLDKDPEYVEIGILCRKVEVLR